MIDKSDWNPDSNFWVATLIYAAVAFGIALRFAWIGQEEKKDKWIELCVKALIVSFIIYWWENPPG